MVKRTAMFATCAAVRVRGGATIVCANFLRREADHARQPGRSASADGAARAAGAADPGAAGAGASAAAADDPDAAGSESASAC
jgi:hypothetical protein